jgi:hypothetical protein
MSSIRSRRSALIVLAALGCVACSTTPTQTVEPREDRVYRTGSHIPVKDTDSAYVQSMDQQQAKDMLNKPGATATSGK